MLAVRIAAKSMPDTSAMSRSEVEPSEYAYVHNIAITASVAATPPMAG